jgi:hypothetical protein
MYVNKYLRYKLRNTYFSMEYNTRARKQEIQVTEIKRQDGNKKGGSGKIIQKLKASTNRVVSRPAEKSWTTIL